MLCLQRSITSVLTGAGYCAVFEVYPWPFMPIIAGFIWYPYCCAIGYPAGVGYPICGGNCCIDMRFPYWDMVTGR